MIGPTIRTTQQPCSDFVVLRIRNHHGAEPMGTGCVCPSYIFLYIIFRFLSDRGANVKCQTSIHNIVANTHRSGNTQLYRIVSHRIRGSRCDGADLDSARHGPANRPRSEPTILAPHTANNNGLAELGYFLFAQRRTAQGKNINDVTAVECLLPVYRCNKNNFSGHPRRGRFLVFC